jgi:hypothetical protein
MPGNPDSTITVHSSERPRPRAARLSQPRTGVPVRICANVLRLSRLGCVNSTVTGPRKHCQAVHAYPRIPTQGQLVSCMQNRGMFIHPAHAGPARLPSIRAGVESAEGLERLRHGRRRASHVSFDRHGQREAPARQEEDPAVVLHAFELARLVGVARRAGTEPPSSRRAAGPARARGRTPSIRVRGQARPTRLLNGARSNRSSASRGTTTPSSPITRKTSPEQFIPTVESVPPRRYGRPNSSPEIPTGDASTGSPAGFAAPDSSAATPPSGRRAPSPRAGAGRREAGRLRWARRPRDRVPGREHPPARPGAPIRGSPAGRGRWRARARRP